MMHYLIDFIFNLLFLSIFLQLNVKADLPIHCLKHDVFRFIYR